MPNIATIDARGLFTNALVEVYSERPKTTGFLRSFFKVTESDSKNISIAVQRGSERVAVDVIRGTEGNRNTFSKSSEKIFMPPYYREFFDATELDLYDRLYSNSSIDSGVFAKFIQSVSDKLGMLQDKIERAYELQCANVLETGIVSLVNGTNINFNRKAGSLIDLGSGNYFTSAVDPFKVLENGCVFLRQTGKSAGGVFNAICGSVALAELLANTLFTQRQNLFNMSLDSVVGPQMSATGATYHGTLTCGSYKVQLWAYPQSYENASGVNTPYLNDKKITLLPIDPQFILSFAAVPQLLSGGVAPKKGAYLIGDYVDERMVAHIFDIKSAGVAIPVAVDQIYTVKVVGG